MKRIIGTFLFIAAVQLLAAQLNVRFEIRQQPPQLAPVDIYAAGSFNGWNPKDENYRFSRNEKGEYYLLVKLAKGLHELKLTRGGWDKVETKKGGAGMGNRVLQLESDTTVHINIEDWADRYPTAPRKSTAGKNVSVLDTAFFIPQLNRKRRVWIYLPESYSRSRSKYPVLYMHDGQNVFDDATSYSGEWGVDETLDNLDAGLKECIVVAIDHGGNMRLNEYNPYDTERFGKGEGDLYVDFLANTLKPYIDKRYRTKKGCEHTFIAGSSMGGLISLYAVLKYPKKFGAAGVFSPAFWIGSGIYNDIRKNAAKVKSRIYFYGGKLENDEMVPDMLKAFHEMKKVSKAGMKVVIRDEGKHNEPTWREEFPLFYDWLMK